MEDKKLAASDVLRGVVDGNFADRISLADIKTSLHKRGFGLLMVICAIPVSLPIPIPPGLTSIPAIPLLILSLQMVMGLDSPWLPKWVSKRTIKRTTLASLIEAASPHLKKIEKFLKPRLSFASSRHGEKIIGIFATIFSISVMLPVPFTNMIPALGILIMSLGLLSKDGITIIIGMVIGSVGVCLSTLIVILGEKVVSGMIGGLGGVIN